MIEQLIQILNEESFEDTFKPASEDEQQARRDKGIDDRWKQHEAELDKLTPIWRKFFGVINNKDSLVKIIINSIDVAEPDVKHDGKKSIYEHVTFDVVLNIRGDIYVDSDNDFVDRITFTPSDRFMDDVIAAEKTHLKDGHLGWNNSGTTGWATHYIRNINAPARF